MEEKDQVVLSREEWKQIKNSLYYSKEELERKLQKERKETAEKYKGFIRELLTNGDDSITTYYGDVKYRLIREDDLQELAKQFGVGKGENHER